MGVTSSTHGFGIRRARALYLQNSKNRRLSACLLGAAILLILAFGIRHSDRPESHSDIQTAGAFPTISDARFANAPVYVQSMVAHGINPQDVIRGFWFPFSYEPEPGPRLWLQVNDATWIERWPSGHRTRFLILGRAVVNGDSGTLLLKIYSDPYPGRLPIDGRFEVFLPDSDSKTMVALFRKFDNGKWGTWQTLSALHILK